MSARLPARVSSDILARLAQPGEPSILIKACNVGDVSPYELSDENGRSFIFRWNTRLGGHELFIPVSIWMQDNAKLAHDIMDRRNPPVPLVALFPQLPPMQDGQTVSRQPHTLEITGSTPVPAPTQPEAPIIVENETPETQGAGEGPFLHEAIAAAVKDKAKRVADLAEELGASEDEIREAIGSEVSTVHIAGAGWVKPKEE